jgi:hypothetical protein
MYQDSAMFGDDQVHGYEHVQEELRIAGMRLTTHLLMQTFKNQKKCFCPAYF